MEYIIKNKQAWEEAFEHRHANWGEDDYKRLRDERLPFFCEDLRAELETINFNDKTIAQFCCNNGRELLSLMQLGATKGVGFDIAANIIQQAKETANKAQIENCQFVNTNILEIDSQYEKFFDFIIFTVGAITWFEDLKLLFQKVSDCLKPNGLMLIHDYHPFMNMLPVPNEPDFVEQLDRLAYSYFRREPWVENEGMGYMSEQYKSKIFTSFPHTMSDIINTLHYSKMNVTKLNEYDYDVGLTNVYDNRGYPLSFILIAKKA